MRIVRHSGGNASAVLSLDAALGEVSQGSPQFLPDGQRFLYVSSGKDRGNIFLGSLDGKTRRLLFNNPNSPATYVPGPNGRGYLLFQS